MQGASVLVVEDDWCVRECVRDLLEDAGFVVMCSGNGAEALLAGATSPSS